MAADIDINYVTRYVGKGAALAAVGDNKKVQKSVDDVTASTKESTTANNKFSKSNDRVGESIRGVTGDTKKSTSTHSEYQKVVGKSKKANDDLTESLRGMNTRFQAFGNLMKLIKWPAFIAGAGFAVQAVSALSVGVVALTGSLSSLSGVLVAYPALLGAVGQGFGTALLALSPLKEGLKELAKKHEEAEEAAGRHVTALGKMSPTVRKFTKFIFGLQNNLSDLQNVAGDAMFPGLEKGIKKAMPILGPLKDMLKLTGKVMGGLAEQTGAWVGSKGFGKDFKTIGEGNARLLGQLGQSGIMFGKSLENIMVAAQPFIKWMGQGIEAFAHWTETSTKAGRANGGLAKFFDETKESIKRVWAIVKPFGTALWNIMKLAKPLGNEILDSLGKGAKSLEAFTESTKGKNEIKEYFEKAKAPIYAMGRLVRDIATDFIKLGNQPGITELTETVRTQLLPVITELISETTKGLGPPLIKMLEQVSRLFATLGGSSGPFNTFITSVGKLLTLMNNILDTVPGARTALSAFLGVMAVGKATKFVSALTGLDKMGPIFKKLIKWQRDYNTAVAEGDIAESFGGRLGGWKAGRKAETVASKSGTTESIVMDALGIGSNAGGGKGLTGAISKLTGLLGGGGGLKTLAARGGVAAVGGAAAYGAGKLVGGLGGEAITNIGGGAAAGMMFGPWGAAAGAALGAIYTFRKQLKVVMEDVVGFVKQHSILIAAAFSFILGPLPLLVAAFLKWRTQIEGAVSSVVTFFQKLPGRIAAGVEALPGMLLAVAKKLPQFTGQVIGFFATLPIRIGILMAKLQVKVVSTFIELAPKVAGVVARLAANVAQGFASMVAQSVKAVLRLAARVPGIVGGAVSSMASAAAHAGGKVIAWFASLPGKAVSALGSLAPKLLNVGVHAVESIASGLHQGSSGIWSWIGSLPGKLLSAVEGAASAFLSVGAKIAGEIGKGFLDALPGPVKDALSAAGGVGHEVLSWAGLGATGGVVQPTGLIGSAGRNGKRRFADGGVMGSWGAKGYDSMLAMVAPGEVVLTHHHQEPINEAVEAFHGVSLPGLVEGIQTPHHYATGGAVKKAAGRNPLAGQIMPDIAASAQERALFKLYGVKGFATGGEQTTGTSPLARMMADAKRLSGIPYPHPDQHFGLSANPSALDCSAAVSNVLWKGGLLSTEMASPALESWGTAGTGTNGLTVFANTGHAWMELAGHPWGTSVGDSGSGGLGFHPQPSSDYKAGFRARHWPGNLGSLGSATSAAGALTVKGTPAKPFVAHEKPVTFGENKATGLPTYNLVSSLKQALSGYAPKKKAAKAATGSTAGEPKGGKPSGKTISGKVSYFGGGEENSGMDTSQPGIAVNLHPGTESGWDNSITRGWMDKARSGHPQFARVSISGKSANLPISDLGPAGFTQRAIDVTEGGVKKLGFSNSTFPTDATGTAKLFARGGVAGRSRSAGSRRFSGRRFANGGIGGSRTFPQQNPAGGLTYQPKTRFPELGGAGVVPALPRGLIAKLLARDSELPKALKAVASQIDQFGIYKTASIAKQIQEAWGANESGTTDAEQKALVAAAVTTGASWVQDIAKTSGHLQAVMIGKAVKSVQFQIAQLQKGGVTAVEQKPYQSLLNQRTDLRGLRVANLAGNVEHNVNLQGTINSATKQLTNIGKGNANAAAGKTANALRSVIFAAQNKVIENVFAGRNSGSIATGIKTVEQRIKALMHGGVTPKEKSQIRKLQKLIGVGQNSLVTALVGKENLDGLLTFQKQIAAKIAALQKGKLNREKRTMLHSLRALMGSIGESITTVSESIKEAADAAREAAETAAQEAAEAAQLVKEQITESYVNAAEVYGRREQGAETGLETLELHQKLAGISGTQAGAEQASYITSTIIPAITAHISGLEAEASRYSEQGEYASYENVIAEIQSEQNHILSEQLAAQEAIKSAAEETADTLSQAAGSLGFSFNSQSFTDLLGAGIGT